MCGSIGLDGFLQRGTLESTKRNTQENRSLPQLWLGTDAGDESFQIGLKSGVGTVRIGLVRVPGDVYVCSPFVRADAQHDKFRRGFERSRHAFQNMTPQVAGTRRVTGIDDAHRHSGPWMDDAD